MFILLVLLVFQSQSGYDILNRLVVVVLSHSVRDHVILLQSVVSWVGADRDWETLTTLGE